MPRRKVRMKVSLNVFETITLITGKMLEQNFCPILVFRAEEQRRSCA